MADQLIKMRVTNRYRGVEGGMVAVEEGTIVHVSAKRAQELIAANNAVPITGPSQTAEQKAAAGKEGATAGVAARSSSSPAVPASRKPIATKQPAAKKKTGGRSSR